jgi:hypothetical protein
VKKAIEVMKSMKVPKVTKAMKVTKAKGSNANTLHLFANTKH